MARAFLSHSSKNKDFVGYIADNLGRTKSLYDVFEFEAGEKTLEEILKALDKSDLFVFLYQTQH